MATFREVAGTLSFTRAAEALDYAQSSVSSQIQELEAELGSPLFERLGKRITLSDAGQRLLPYAERMLQMADEARAAVPSSEEPSGALTIGTPESLCIHRLPPVLSAFRARHPRVQLVFRPAFGFDLRRALNEGRVDLGFFYDYPQGQPDLVTESLVAEPLVLLAHPDHPLAARTRVDTYMLHGESMLLTETGCVYRERFERLLTMAGAHPTSTVEFSSIEAIKQCVMVGMGLSLLPEVTVRQELALGRMVALPWSEKDFGLVTLMAWHHDKWLSPALRAFISLSRELLAAPHSLPSPVPLARKSLARAR
ncbi:MAG TPA: LysR family transcriptional regulator [Chloroflexota bacterium]|nr:LysR family transcriptional regulator [Chloroflexota bacterium]